MFCRTFCVCLVCEVVIYIYFLQLGIVIIVVINQLMKLTWRKSIAMTVLTGMMQSRCESENWFSFLILSFLVNFSDQVNSEHYRNQVPSNKIIILGLAQHITETDVSFYLFIVKLVRSLAFNNHVLTRPSVQKS